MTFYMVSWKQVTAFAAILGFFLSACAGFTVTYLSFLELPEVHIDGSGACVKIVNFKNGDAYACPDRDVTLRKYRVIK